MRKVLLTVLLFAIFSSTIAYEEFTDSRGQCWRCYPEKPCERCPRFSNDLWPTSHSDICFEPNCNIPENRRFLFPSRESDRYFRCVYNHNHWTHETVSCRCGTLFNMRTQECVAPRNWTPFCVELITPIMMRSCETGNRILVIGNEVEQTTRMAPFPEWVTSTIEFTTPNGPTLNTTVGDGDMQTPPGNGNGNGTTTASPCICIIWWRPCPCNPCWPRTCMMG
ncbi:hypothetical protein PVAND_015748 [Polypedilum vanderplanki]|uniref:Chitin-binding type-2 domain-containing protein n=1 Tax=Polypedilum vanderplanki TaxID=319348 RepID=A0A9J6BDJ2_POLVA|nr:hypothetical protein PVAND_015748 [Polypedilum vanderplanki]